MLQFSWKCNGFKSKYCSALIVLAETARAKVLALREIETSNECLVCTWEWGASLSVQIFDRMSIQTEIRQVEKTCWNTFSNYYAMYSLLQALSNIACMFCCRCQYGVTEWLSPRSTLHLHTLCMCKFNVFNSKTSSHWTQRGVRCAPEIAKM